MKTSKAILYVRVSTDEQAEKGHSLAHQEERLRNYCKTNNIEVVAFFKDDHSAKSFDRPEFKKLLAFIKTNKHLADMLLFLKWDRFSRNAADAYAMINQLTRLGVDPQAMEQPLNMEIPEHKFMLAIYLAAPEVENDRRALNIIAGMRKAMKEGRWMGSAPKGYKRSHDENNRPCIVPGKDVEMVRWIFEQMATGVYHIDELRKIVNSKGFKIERNGFWWLLRSPVYIGKVSVAAYKDEPAQVVQGKHEPIISENLFYAVQEVLEGRKRIDLPPQYSKRDELPLRGFLKCPNCGGNLTGSGSKGNGGRYFYYHCKSKCKIRYRATEVNQGFDDELNFISECEKVLRSFDRMLSNHRKENQKDKSSELTKLKKDLENCDKRLENAQTLMLDEKLEANEYKNIKSRLEPEKGKLLMKISQLEEKDPEENKIKEFGFNYLRNLNQLFWIATLEDRHTLLCSTLSDKLKFEDGKVRTMSGNDIISLIRKADKRLEVNKKGQLKNFSCPSHRVETTGIEPVSKHILQKLSTCLFCFGFSGSNWKQTTDHFLSCIVFCYSHSLLQQHPVLFVIGRGSGQQDCLPPGHNDYLITD
jgi:site-specific DNA recombinase